jgi:hypothetical protein
MRPFLCVLVAMACGGRAGADSLDIAIQSHVDSLVKKLRADECRTAGVLKFLVLRDSEKQLTDHAGPINISLARRLELALILSNENHPTDAAKQIRIIRDASAVAEKLAGANHRTEAGRKVLLGADYPPAWGDKPLRPDVLLTGYARVLEDGKIRVTVMGFRAGREPETLERFDVDPDPTAMVEMGRSFRLRDVFGGGTVQPSAADVRAETLKSAEKVRKGDEKHPALPESGSPVGLKILYDDHVIKVEARDGEAWIPEPKEGQKVKLVLERKGRERYAAVLKVNGENTLERQRLRDEDCWKWILEPDAGPLEISGFQVGSEKAEEFKVLSQAESKEAEVRYGKDVGLISLTVFGERKAAERKVTLKDDELDRLVMQRGEYPEKPAADLQELKAKLRRLTPAAERGLIASGTKIDSAVVKVDFKLDRTPIFSATIRYYKPAKP